MATRTSPTQMSGAYKVESHSGSNDIHQSMAAKLAVTPRAIKPSTLHLAGNREITIQTTKYTTARATKNGAFR